MSALPWSPTESEEDPDYHVGPLVPFPGRGPPAAPAAPVAATPAATGTPPIVVHVHTAPPAAPSRESTLLTARPWPLSREGLGWLLFLLLLIAAGGSGFVWAWRILHDLGVL